MLIVPLNMRTVKIKLSRHQVIKLMLACVTMSQIVGSADTEWDKIHDALSEQLKAFDNSVEKVEVVPL